jgi:hypothetical protein
LPPKPLSYPLAHFFAKAKALHKSPKKASDSEDKICVDNPLMHPDMKQKLIKPMIFTAQAEAIVGATGAYSSFTGGNIFENATGSDPYEADLYFMRPSSTSSGGYYLSAGSAASSLILWVTAAVFGF